ncbi:four helix bundle protein [Echinicola sp. CAU 1574]|uniref:Four helix bundle protein n=1 Tax=Echinicola arenosa TaxID=2774144 RepID=A0ABR9AMR0_9BACT|nr:four helix bundle protein [Echinicola arenosa]MBD8490093.1 four helix bundle protein [Echinicola arenosa]
MSYHIYSFEKLEVYQLARKFRVEIREIVKGFPREERFELTNQLKRATDSIATNLAEGSGRSSNMDQAHFTNIACSSALETIDHLTAALDLDFISEEVYSSQRLKLDEIINKLNALYRFQLNNKNTLKKRY